MVRRQDNLPQQQRRRPRRGVHCERHHAVRIEAGVLQAARPHYYRLLPRTTAGRDETWWPHVDRECACCCGEMAYGLNCVQTTKLGRRSRQQEKKLRIDMHRGQGSTADDRIRRALLRPCGS